jgi:3-oxoacyl-[acyl-carrier-protein] synthase-3
MVDSTYTADPSRCEAVVVDTFRHFRQDGRAVRDFSVRQTVRLIKALENSYPIDWNRDIFIGHQANRTMLEQITNNREIPPTNHWHNVTHLGNQAGAGAPAVLSEHWDKIQQGQQIVVAVVGAGLSWGSILMRAV